MSYDMSYDNVCESGSSSIYVHPFKEKNTNVSGIVDGGGGANNTSPQKFLAVGKLLENVLVKTFSSWNAKLGWKSPI